MFILVFLIKTGAPNAEAQDSLPLKQTWSPHRVNLWKFSPRHWELVHFKTRGKWLYIGEK